MGKYEKNPGIQPTAWTYCTAGTDGTWSWDAAAGTRGPMYAGGRTPDGFQVQAGGQWDGQAAVPAE